MDGQLRLDALTWPAAGKRYGLSADRLEVWQREVGVVVADDVIATDLANVIVGLARPAEVEGTVWLHGEDITDRPAGQRRIGLVPIDGGLLPHLRVEGNIAFGRRTYVRSRVLDMEPRLRDVLSEYPHALSPGQRLQVAVVRALCRRPKPKAIVIEDRAGHASCRAAVATAVAQHLAVLVITDERERGEDITSEFRYTDDTRRGCAPDTAVTHVVIRKARTEARGET